MDYLELLDRLHAALAPSAYLEIGVDLGLSLAISRARSVAIDPNPRPSAEAMLGKPWVKLFRTTSDAFFREHARDATLEAQALDLVFIDGLHEFAQVVRDFENVERWSHPGTVVVIHDVLPVNAWQATRLQHGGSWTGDVWRIVPFLQRYRPDLRCFLIDVWETGVLVVTDLSPGHSSVADAAAALDRTFPPDGPDYEDLVERWLADAKPLPPESLLTALYPTPRLVDHHVEHNGWSDTSGGRVADEDDAAGALFIAFREPIRGSHHARIRLLASGMPVLRIRLHSEAPDGPRERDIHLDVTHPGALHHDLDALWLDAHPSSDSFELDWEGALTPGEALLAFSLAPVDFWLQDTFAGEKRIELHSVEVEQIAWPRPGTRFAPERFPDRLLAAKRKEGKRDAVIFAWWTPDTPEARKVGEYYLGLLRYHHADSKIFVGINHDSDSSWNSILESSGLDLEICPAAPAVQVTSDVGGFLTALGAFARYPEEFDLVWFGHTKGASRAAYEHYSQFRYQHDRRFWSRRSDIDRFFADAKIGLYSHRYALHDPSEDVPWRGFSDLDALERVYREDFAPLGLWAWETVFVMRDRIVRRFCESVGEEFFGIDPREYGAGRWWIEAAFPSIASMQGYEPLIEVDTDGEGSQRNDILLYDDPRQTNRLALEELRRWRQDPFTFAPRALPRGYT